jgi:hypothetical protein
LKALPLLFSSVHSTGMMTWHVQLPRAQLQNSVGCQVKEGPSLQLLASSFLLKSRRSCIDTSWRYPQSINRPPWAAPMDKNLERDVARYHQQQRIQKSSSCLGRASGCFCFSCPACPWKTEPTDPWLTSRINMVKRVFATEDVNIML